MVEYGYGRLGGIISRQYFQVFDKGGLCGGSPYIFSRGALVNILSKGDDALMSEFVRYGDQRMPEDVADACARASYYVVQA